MKLTRYTDYALRVLIYLGLHADRQCSIREIAHSYGASENHLMKVVQELARSGFVASMRGRGGGLRLGRRPQSIGVGEVVRLTEPDFDIADCASCILAPACGLTPVLTQATAAFLAVLDRYTLADLIRSAGAQRALLHAGPGIPGGAPHGAGDGDRSHLPRKVRPRRATGTATGT